MGIITLSLFIFLISNSSAFLFKRGKRPLAIDGGWSAWGSWNSCHLNTENSTDYFSRYRGFSVSSRPRPCESPKPQRGGKPCQGSAFRYRQCGCKNPLGMQSGRIENFQLSSSVGIYKDFDATKGRLGHPSAWCSDEKKSPFASVYYEIDFVNFTQITGLTTEGMREGRVSRFKLEYSFDKKKWKLYTDKARKRGVFTGNISPSTRKFNEIYNPFVTRYIRIYPVHSYTRPCLNVEVFGCVFTCGKQFSSPSGEIIARSEESFNQKCLWKIDVKNTTVITFDFVTFDVPCEYGFVEIRDGSKPFLKSKILKKICGQELLSELYTAPAKNLWIYFSSNSSSDEVGFRTRYISECKNNLELKGTEMLTITTPNYPNDYFDNNRCTWNIISDSTQIYLIFKIFDIEASSNNDDEKCKNDYLSIESQGTQNSLKYKYCNSYKPLLNPNPILIKRNQIKLEFKSDDAIVGKGFLVHLTNYDPTKPKPTQKVTEMALVTYPTHEPKEVLSNVDKKNLNTKPAEVTPKILEPNIMLSKRPLVNATENVAKFNDTGIGSQRFQKKEKKTDWTIIMVASFSIVVFVLIVFVSVISIRKWLTGTQNSKFLSATVVNPHNKNMETKQDGKDNDKINSALVKREEQFCQLKSPAGSIAQADEESEEENAEEMPLTTAIVSHTVEVELQRPRSYIDMYTDGTISDMDSESLNLNIDNKDSISPVETVI